MKQLDQTLGRFSAMRTVREPSGGWIRSIREALGMGLESFANKVGVTTRSAALKLEKNEVSGAITLRRLKDAADALGCELIVAFVPREPLLDQAQRQALTRARKRLSRVEHTMQMESQGVGQPEIEEMVRQVADEIFKKGGTALWG
jgi:predicted DNA-binding mobile mystery protein A